MADKSSKLDPETLILRASPRKVVRFKRSLLIGVAGAAAVAIFGATWFALRDAHLGHHQNDQELYNTDRKRMPDEMAALPSSYDKVKLGSPLPGDLGPSVADRERSLGINPTDTSFKPNPEDDAARAERMRLAQQARQADEAGVFFQTSNTGHDILAAAASAIGGGAGNSSTGNDTTQAESPSDKLNLDPQKDQNAQQQKLDFVNAKADKDIYNPHALQEPVSPYEILAGSIISASLITGINSDLPGLVVAQVTENVFDSVSGQILLIPQGSKIIGRVDNVVAFHQSRALVVWQRIIMPNGTSIQIDNLPATDAAGYAGLEDEVDYHTWTLLEGIAMSTLLGIGGEITFGNNNSDLVEAIRESTSESTNQAGQQIVQKDLDVQPTITIRPGWPLRVILNKDLLLRPYSG